MDRIQSRGLEPELRKPGARFSGILSILFILFKVWIEPCRRLCVLPQPPRPLRSKSGDRTLKAATRSRSQPRGIADRIART